MMSIYDILKPLQSRLNALLSMAAEAIEFQVYPVGWYPLHPYTILKAAHDAVEKQSKHRDDLYYELAWTMYWLAKQYDPVATDAEVELIGSRDRMPLNCILDHAYRQGMVAR